MEDAEAEGDREKNFVVITGLKEFGDANEMDYDNAHPNPKRQRLSDQGAAQPSNPPQPSYSVTVKLQYGRYWVEYMCTYSPSTATFVNLQPTEISAASVASLEAQEKTNKDMYEQLVAWETVMMYVDTRDDEGERFLLVESRGLSGLEQEERHFLCKMRTLSEDFLVGQECALSQGEMERLGLGREGN